MEGTLATVWNNVSSFLDARVAAWRTGSRGSQAYVLGVLSLGVIVCFDIELIAPALPFSVWFVWLILGVLVLRFAPLLLLCVLILALATASTFRDGFAFDARTGAIATLVLCQALILYQSRSQRSGLPFALSEQVLANLRDRLQSQAAIPDLPAGWKSHSSMLSAHGARYAGDFLVADMSDGRHLELVLVDVSGKGLAVGPQALQFAGALGGLVGGMAPQELMRAANAFLLRQESDEAFATAVHLLVDVETGHYVVTSAGHPPALRWDLQQDAWVLDDASGIALGVTPDAEFESSTGQLAPGEALLFYTDGVVEARGRDLEDGINWLLETARQAVEPGYEGAAGRILRHVPRGQDDRAVIVIERVGPPKEDPNAHVRRAWWKPQWKAQGQAQWKARWNVSSSAVAQSLGQHRGQPRG